MKIWQHVLVVVALCVGTLVSAFVVNLITDSAIAIKLISRSVGVISMLVTYFTLQDMNEEKAYKQRFSE